MAIQGDPPKISNNFSRDLFIKNTKCQKINKYIDYQAVVGGKAVPKN